MGREWTRTTIGELLESFGGEIKTGPFGTKLKASEYSNSGVPVISVGEVQLGRLVVHERTPKVASDVTNRMPEYLLQEGDIVFGRKGAVERSARVAVEQAGWFLGSDGIRLRLPSFCDSRFVSYLLLSKQHQKWMIQHSAGTTMASLNEKIVRRVPLILPPINIQKKIAEVLGTLDNKIDLNRQMNTTLETMAQALFKSWFVDFDPVIDNALAAGNTIPEPFHARAEARKALGDQRKPLPAAIQHQFPDRFVLTEEMGWVPEGWEIVPLMEFGRIVCGKTPSKSKSEYFGKDTPFIKIPDMHTSMFVVDPIEKLSELGASSQAKKSVPRGSVCVSCIATVGKVVIASTESQTNQQINSVVPRAEYLTPYLYFYMLSLERLFHDLASGGSATLNMNTSTFSRVRVLKPCKVLLRFFGDSVQSQFSKIEINQKESMTLTKLRDTLLPKLLSGELRIPEDEQ